MIDVIREVMYTKPELASLICRLASGIIIFPYGMQKLMGWFGGTGINGALEDLGEKKIPLSISWLIIIGQAFGSVALMLGLFGRVAAVGNLIIFSGALIRHLPDGWMLNWFNTKKGEGIEYFVLLLSLLLIVLINGSGAYSFDLYLSLKCQITH
jgi:putative oxidoreductase